MADTHCSKAYGHKTQSFMKNGRQQKVLDKALDEQENFEMIFSKI